MSSTSTRTFEFNDEKSSKFWEITRAGSVVTVKYGKTGTNGQTQEKEFADAASALKHVGKLIAEKAGKGYVELGDAPVSSVGAVMTSDVAAEQAQQPAAKARPEIAITARSTKAKNPLHDLEATAESLTSLFGEDDATNRLLAKHPRASAELLEKLSHSSDQSTRKSVAGNPNTPPETLIRLGRQFPQEFLANPALDLLLMVNPALMEEVHETLLVRLLKQADCPASLLNWAASHPQAKVQLAVAMNAKAPEQALAKLRASGHAAVRESLQTQTGSPLDQDPEQAFEHAVRERLGSMALDALDEAWSSGDIGLAQWAALPLTFRLAKEANDNLLFLGAIVRMLTDTSWTLETIRKALPGYQCWDVVAGHPKISLAALQEFANDSDPIIRGSVAENPSTPVAMLEALAKDNEDYVRQSVARNPSAPVSALEEFAKDKEIVVRQSVAANPSTSIAIRAALLETLAKDKDDYVRQSVAENPSTPVSVLETLANDKEDHVRQSVAENPSAPVSVLETLAKDKDDYVRQSVAENPSTPVSVLEALANDKEDHVRQSVAENPSAPVSVLETLAKDKDDYVRRSVAENRSTPASVLELLVTDSNERVRQSVGNNGLAPSFVLVALSKDKASGVRAATAANHATPSEVLVRLASDRIAEVAFAAIRNPSTPLKELVSLIEKKSEGVRKALTRHAHRSADLCRTLWRDASRDVRAALIGNEALDSKTLDEMAQNVEVERDLMALLGHPNLSAESAQMLTDKLFATPAEASAWYRDEVAKARPEVAAAVQAGSILAYTGKDPNKAVLAKRAIAPVMALCAGPFVEPSRIAKVAGSTDWLVRAVVARNPGTPPNLLKKLSADTHPLVALLAQTMMRKQEGAQPNGLVQPAAGMDVRRATEEILGRIPGAGVGLVVRGLSNFFADDVWCEHLTAGQISWMTAARVKGVGFKEFPPLQRNLESEQAAFMVEAAVTFEKGLGAVDSYVQMWAAEEPACPVRVLKSLADDADPDIVLAAMGHPAFPPEEMEPARQGLLKLRGKQLQDLLKNKSVPGEILAAKSTSKDINTRQTIAGNPSTPVHVLEALAKDTVGWVRQTIVSNTATPVPVLEALAKDEDSNVRRSVAANPSTPVPVLDALAKDKDSEVRRSVAANPSTPVLVLEALATDTNSEVLQYVAANPSTPIAIQAALLEALAGVSNPWVFRSIAANPSAPGSVLEALAKDKDILVRQHVAANPSAPIAIRAALLEALARDSYPGNRRSAAANPSTPVSVLEALAKDTNSDVRRSAAANPSTPVSVLEALSEDKESVVRLFVVRNPSTPVSVLRRLAADASLEVRWAASLNQPDLAELRERFLDWWLARLQRSIQREMGVRQGLSAAEPGRVVRPVDLLRALDWLGLASLSDDNKALTKASRSKDWLVRLGAALHPAATEGILKLLRQDSDPDVVRAAEMDRSLLSSLQTE